jgi:CRISPR-associated protein (TIGR02710 family)
MKPVLVLTVGGSHQPVVTSIDQHQPAKVFFLCSADSGKAKGSYVQVSGKGKVLKSKRDLDKPDLPNIATLTGLRPEQIHVHCIEHFDDLNTCYLDALKTIEQARADFPEARIIIDYTGGTKSMTAGLTAAALDDGRCDICLVAGRREDLIAVQDRTEFVRPVRVWDAQAMRRLREARGLLARYDYAGSEELLRAAAASFASEQTIQTLQRGIALCRAFDVWDKFDHALACQLL